MNIFVQPMPWWATAACVLILLSAIVGAVPAVRRLNGAIRACENEPDLVRAAKRAVVELVLRHLLVIAAAIGLGAGALLDWTPAWFGLATALLAAGLWLKIIAGFAMSRSMLARATAAEVANAASKDVEWLRSQR
jgi:hypothetical protein